MDSLLTEQYSAELPTSRSEPSYEPPLVPRTVGGARASPPFVPIPRHPLDSHGQATVTAWLGSPTHRGLYRPPMLVWCKPGLLSSTPRATLDRRLEPVDTQRQLFSDGVAVFAQCPRGVASMPGVWCEWSLCETASAPGVGTARPGRRSKAVYGRSVSEQLLVTTQPPTPSWTFNQHTHSPDFCRNQNVLPTGWFFHGKIFGWIFAKT